MSPSPPTAGPRPRALLLATLAAGAAVAGCLRPELPAIDRRYVEAYRLAYEGYRRMYRDGERFPESRCFARTPLMVDVKEGDTEVTVELRPKDQDDCCPHLMIGSCGYLRVRVEFDDAGVPRVKERLTVQ